MTKLEELDEALKGWMRWRAPVHVLVPVSGGKDSQACLKLAVETHGPDVVMGLFCDTQFEHPLSYEHVEYMRKLYGARILSVTTGSVPDKVLKHNRFPSFAARHCTDELKMRPTRDFCRFLARRQGHGFEVWYGMRSNESAARKKRYMGRVCDEVYPPHEVFPKKYPKYLSKMGVSFRLSVLDWSTEDVKEFVGDDHLNPLYGEGFDRVGCFPCLASADKWKVKAFQHDEFGQKQLSKVLWLQQETGKSVWNKEVNGIGCELCSI